MSNNQDDFDDYFYDDDRLDELIAMDREIQTYNKSVNMSNGTTDDEDDYTAELLKFEEATNNLDPTSSTTISPFSYPQALYKGGYRRVSQVYNDPTPGQQRGCEACGSLHNVLHERFHQHFNIVVCTNCVYCEENISPIILPYDIEHNINDEVHHNDNTDNDKNNNEKNNNDNNTKEDDKILSLYYNKQFIKLYHPDILNMPLNQRYNTMNKTLIREMYILTEKDISSLQFITCKNPWSKDKQQQKSSIPGQNNGNNNNNNNISAQNGQNRQNGINNQQNRQNSRFRPQLVLELSLSTMKLYLNIQCLELTLKKHTSLQHIKNLKQNKQQKGLEKQILQRAQEEREKEIILQCKEQGMSKDLIYMKLLAEQHIIKKQAKDRLKLKKQQERQETAIQNNINDESTITDDSENETTTTTTTTPSTRKSIKKEKSIQNDIKSINTAPSTYDTEADLIMSWFTIPIAPVDDSNEKQKDNDDDGNDDDKNEEITMTATATKKTNKRKAKVQKIDLDTDDDIDTVTPKPSKIPKKVTKKRQKINNDDEDDSDEVDPIISSKLPTRRSSRVSTKFLVSNSEDDDDNSDDGDNNKLNKKYKKNIKNRNNDDSDSDSGSNSESDSDIQISRGRRPGKKTPTTKKVSTTTTKPAAKKATQKAKKLKADHDDNDNNSDDDSDDYLPYQLGIKGAKEKLQNNSTSSKKANNKKTPAVTTYRSAAHQHNYIQVSPGLERCDCGAESEYIAL